MKPRNQFKQWNTYWYTLVLVVIITTTSPISKGDSLSQTLLFNLPIGFLICLPVVAFVRWGYFKLKDSADGIDAQKEVK